MTYRQHRQRAIDIWTREYLEKLLTKFNGNLSQAARDQEMDRNHLRDLVRLYGFDRKDYRKGAPKTETIDTEEVHFDEFI